MHFCYECGEEFVSFRETLKHALEKHEDKLDEYWKNKYHKWLSKTWKCQDCIHHAVIYTGIEEHEPLKKACPKNYLFNCSNPAEKCPNFTPKGGLLDEI